MDNFAPFTLDLLPLTDFRTELPRHPKGFEEWQLHPFLLFSSNS